MLKLVFAALGCAVTAGSGLAMPAADGFAGDWSDSEALRLLFHNYNPTLKESLWSPVDVEMIHGFFMRTVLESTDPPSSYVSVLQSLEVTVRGKKQRHLYTSGRDGLPDNALAGCRSCPVVIGAALFEQEGRRWVLRNWQPYLSEEGSWGKPPRVEPVDWGRQTAGILARAGSTHMGITQEYTSFLAFYSGEFSRVFQTETLYDTSGAAGMVSEERRETALAFAEFGPFGIRILVVNGKERYKWDGKQYVSEASGSPLP